MRVELYEKVKDITEEERKMVEDMNIPLRDKRFKWRRRWFDTECVFSVNEVSDKETVVEFHDTTVITVKGSYEDTKKKIEEAENMIEFVPEGDEEDEDD